MSEHQPNVVLLAGGVGGARMARGFAGIVPEGRLSVIVNVGDDEHFHGLTVCPDIDTVTYTLANLVNAQQGWGVAGDSAGALGMLRKLGGIDTWMHLGDADLGLHLFRSQRLAMGETLSAINAHIARSMGVSAAIIPASDKPAPTFIETNEQKMCFQEWFVKHRCAPTVRAVRYETEAAGISPTAAAALKRADLIVIAPSNPLLSVLPMLALPGFRDALTQSAALCVAVSPLIGGRAVKGPLDRLLADLRLGSGNHAVAMLYENLIDSLFIDEVDAAEVSSLEATGLQSVAVTYTLMRDRQGAVALASKLLELTGFDAAARLQPEAA